MRGVGRICDFWPLTRCISVTVRDKAYMCRILLITNSKSYTGFRLAPNSITLDDLECQNRGFNGFFWRFRLGQVYIIHKAALRYWRWWRGVVVNAFRLKRSYSTPGPVSTAMGDCLRVGTAIGFRASREH